MGSSSPLRDTGLQLLLLAVAATLTLYFLGVFVYPFRWMILAILATWRLFAVKENLKR